MYEWSVLWNETHTSPTLHHSTYHSLHIQYLQRSSWGWTVTVRNMYSWHLSINKHLISATTLCISLDCIYIYIYCKNDTRTFKFQVLRLCYIKHYATGIPTITCGLNRLVEGSMRFIPEFRNVRNVKTYQLPRCEVARTSWMQFSAALCSTLLCVWTGASASYTSGHGHS